MRSALVILAAGGVCLLALFAGGSWGPCGPSSITGLIGIFLAAANAVAAFLRFQEQGLLEIVVVIVYAIILLFINNAYAQEPDNNTLKWLISLFIAGIINIISIIIAPIIVPGVMSTSASTSFIFVSPFASLLIGSLVTFLLMPG